MNGVRYLRFGNDLDYATNTFAPNFTGSPDELHYRINIVNNLVGYQTGGRIDYCLCKYVSAYAATKMGIYGNNVTQHQCISNSSGYAFINSPGAPANGQDYNFASNACRASLVGELDFGLLLRFSRCWSMNLGVMAIGASGVALANNQFPTYYYDIDGAKHIKTNGDLFLTGGFATVNYNW